MQAYPPRYFHVVGLIALPALFDAYLPRINRQTRPRPNQSAIARTEITVPPIICPLYPGSPLPDPACAAHTLRVPGMSDTLPTF